MRAGLLEGKMREERVGEVGNVARHKRGLTSWRGGRGRSGLVSLETWHITTRTHFLEGRKREERVGEPTNVARHKRGLTSWRGGRRGRRVVTLDTRHIRATNHFLTIIPLSTAYRPRS